MAESRFGVVVELIDQFTGKMGDIGKGLDNMSGKIKDMSPQFTKMAAGGTAVFTAITGSVTLAVKSFANAGDAIAKMSDKTGFSTVSLSEWKHAADLSGISLEGLEKGFLTMSKFMEAANDGGQGQIDTLKKIGLQLKDLKGLGPEETFEKLAMAVADVDDPMKKLAIASELFGKAGKDMLPLLKGGSKGLAEMREEAHRLGIVFDEDAARASEQFNDNLQRLGDGFTGIKNTIAMAFMPAMTEIFAKIDPLIVKVREWIETHPDLTKNIIIVSAAVAGIVAVIGTLGLVIPAIITGIQAFGAVLAFATGPIGLIVLAIAGLVAAGIYLWRNWDEVSVKIGIMWEKVKSHVIAFWDWVKPYVEIALRAVVAIMTFGWSEVAIGVYQNWDTIKEYFNLTWEFITGVFNTALLWIQTQISVIMTAISETWKAIWGGIKTFFSETWDWLKGLVNEGLEAITGIVDLLGPNISAAFQFLWDGVKGIFSSSLDGLKNMVKGVLDWIEEKIRSALSMISGAVSAVGGYVSGVASRASQSAVSTTTGRMPKLAAGGIVTRPTIAMIGEGGEPEAVIPLSRLKGGFGGGITINISGNSFLDSKAAEKMGDLLMNKLRKNLIPA